MIQGKISTYNHLSDMINSSFLLIGFPQSFNRLKLPFQTFSCITISLQATCMVRESAETPTLNSKYYTHIQMNKQRPSLDMLAQKVDDMLAQKTNGPMPLAQTCLMQNRCSQPKIYFWKLIKVN